jgi:ribosomal protein L11 methylase PrmA
VNNTGEISEMYHAQYQYDSQDEKAREASDEIAKVLSDYFHPKSAFDVGCGGGALIRGFLACGVDAYGVEGSQHAVALMPERIELADLRTKMMWNGGADLVTCFDVAEHIEAGFAEIFVENILARCHSTSHIVFGAAGEGQDGLGHVNCQHPVYWIGLFRNHGWEVLPTDSEYVRADIKRQPHTNHLWWVAKNLMVFSR